MTNFDVAFNYLINFDEAGDMRANEQLSKFLVRNCSRRSQAVSLAATFIFDVACVGPTSKADLPGRLH